MELKVGDKIFITVPFEGITQYGMICTVTIPGPTPAVELPDGMRVILTHSKFIPYKLYLWNKEINELLEEK